MEESPRKPNLQEKGIEDFPKQIPTCKSDLHHLQNHGENNQKSCHGTPTRKQHNNKRAAWLHVWQVMNDPTTGVNGHVDGGVG